MCPVQSVLLVPIAHSPEPDLEPAVYPSSTPHTSSGLLLVYKSIGVQSPFSIQPNILREGSQKKCKSVVFWPNIKMLKSQKPMNILNILPKMDLTLVV